MQPARKASSLPKYGGKRCVECGEALGSAGVIGRLSENMGGWLERPARETGRCILEDEVTDRNVVWRCYSVVCAWLHECNDEMAPFVHMDYRGVLKPDYCTARHFSAFLTHVISSTLRHFIDILAFLRSRYRAHFSSDPVAEHRPSAREDGRPAKRRLWDEREFDAGRGASIFICTVT